MKKIISFIIIACMLLSATTALCAEPISVDDAAWKAYIAANGLSMPFRPENEYVSSQNPPNFTWPFVKNATFDIVVCTDEKLENIAYHKEGIENNFYNFDTVFEKGVHYYWAVRYVTSTTKSDWSTPRRFRIDPDAVDFPVPSMEEMFNRIPKTHPRIYTTADKLDEFREYKDKSASSKAIYNNQIKIADAAILKLEEIHEPDGAFWENPDRTSTTYRENLVGWLGEIEMSLKIAYNGAFAYLLTGDEKYIEPCRLAMLEMTKWDYDNNVTYEHYDLIYRDIFWKTAYALDWTYNKIPESDRKEILELIRKTGTFMANKLLGSLRSEPYASHGWTAYGYIGAAAVALLGEIDEAEEWLKSVIPCYIALLPPWSYQDGGWSQGMKYWTNSTNFNQKLMDVLALSGMINLYDAAWPQHEYLWSLYAFAPGVYATFGDETGSVTLKAHQGTAAMESIYNQTYFTKNPVTKWLLQQQPQSHISSEPDTYYTSVLDDVEAKAPVDYPLAHEFNDIGWVVMTDDLLSLDKIHMTFKSSYYGSYNHSHPDQNSFYLQAFGKKLASRSGYYDSYHSAHDSGFTRKTGAHNSITVATNKGQVDNDFNAKGKLSAFLNQVDFDLVTGDASDAYGNTLEKFERSIIYIRPDMFIIIDDLDGRGNTERTKFEWWLNAESGMEVYQDGTGVKITQENAVLDTSVKYPQKVTTYFNDNFALSDMKEIKPAGTYTGAESEQRVWFETEKVDKTKIVTVLDVHKSSERARYTHTEYFDDYLTMTFEDGTICIVNLGEKTESVDTGTIKFTGESVIYNDETIMLSNGTYLNAYGKDIFKSEHRMSAVVGKDELCLSSYEDNRITVFENNLFLSEIESATNYSGKPIGKEYGISAEEGALVEDKDGVVSVDAKVDAKTFTIDKDNYTLMLNGKIIKSEQVNTEVKVYVDGTLVETKQVHGYTTRDGSVTCSDSIELPSKKYCLERLSEGVKLKNMSLGQQLTISKISLSKVNITENELYFSTCEDVVEQ